MMKKASQPAETTTANEENRPMGEPSPSSADGRRFLLLDILPVVALLVVTLLPLILGQETLYARDVLHSHYPLKAAQAQFMQQGELPLVDPYRASGQPLVGNLNAVPLYPSNLLYLLGSPLWALNAHFWLHWLLAPFAFFWLGRAWGFSRQASWAGGVIYGTSGFFLSQLNLYNLVAGAALAPAMVAACLEAWRGRRRGIIAVGLLWFLLILAGDPLFGGLALALGLSAAIVRSGWRPARPFFFFTSMGFGTLLAAPQIVETWRILDLSYRGYWQYSPQAALAQSWDPRSVLEQLLPFFFGRPDYSFWGRSFFGGNEPLFFSLYPGWLCLALVAAAGLPGDRRRGWMWALVGFGAFLALGAWNPAVRALYQLPGAAMLRYPIKFWLLIAIGLSLLAALGCERLLRLERRPSAGWVLIGGLLFCSGFWAALSFAKPTMLSFLQSFDPQALSTNVLTREYLRWAGVALLSSLTLILMLGLLRMHRRHPTLAIRLMVLLHLATQLFFLRPLYDSDHVEHYQKPPPLLADLPAESLIMHGGFNSAFGNQTGSLNAFPDLRTFWLSRRYFAELYPFAGIQWGRRYAFNPSPEGLDTFFQVALTRRMPHLDDSQRLDLLAASGVDLLLLDRELNPAVLDRVELRRVLEGPVSDLRVYALRDQVAPAQLVGTVWRAPHLNAALELLNAPDFDSRTVTVLPGNGEAREGPPGRVEVVHEKTERLSFDVESEAGGVLMTRRAFLDLYRASIDGEPAPTEVVNIHLLGVEVPAGKHRVEIWVDRRPTWVAWAVTLLGLVGLALMVLRLRAAEKQR